MGVRDAVDFIAQLRQAKDLSALPVGRKVVVIGGGMTAIDAAVQSKRLGADEVTIVYRRGEADMKASGYERELARHDGVLIRHFARRKHSKGEGQARDRRVQHVGRRARSGRRDLFAYARATTVCICCTRPFSAANDAVMALPAPLALPSSSPQRRSSRLTSLPSCRRRRRPCARRQTRTAQSRLMAACSRSLRQERHASGVVFSPRNLDSVQARPR